MLHGLSLGHIWSIFFYFFMFRFFFFGFFGLGRIGWLPKPFLVVGQVEEGGAAGHEPQDQTQNPSKMGISIC